MQSNQDREEIIKKAKKLYENMSFGYDEDGYQVPAFDTLEQIIDEKYNQLILEDLRSKRRENKS